MTYRSLTAFLLVTFTAPFSTPLHSDGVPQMPSSPSGSPSTSSSSTSLSGGGVGFSRYMQYLAASPMRGLRRVEDEGVRADVERHVQMLEEIRMRVMDLDREFGQGPLNLRTKYQKTFKFLTYLGFEKIREGVISPGGGVNESVRRTLVQRAGLDLDTVVQKLRSGMDVDYSIPYLQARLPESQLAWFRDALKEPKLSSEAAIERLLADWHADLLYVTLVHQDGPARELLRRDIGLAALYNDPRLLWGLFNFGDSIIVDSSDGQQLAIRVPGAPSAGEAAAAQRALLQSVPPPWASETISRRDAATRIWTEIAGCSPVEARSFIQRVFSDGRKAYFYAVLGRQPLIKQQVLLCLDGPLAEALSTSKRLFSHAKLPYESAYESGRLSWRKPWDFEDLITLVQVDPMTRRLRIPGSAASWKVGLQNDRPRNLDQAGIARITREISGAQTRLASDPAARDDIESLLVVSKLLAETRDELVRTSRISPVQKFVAVCSLLRDNEKAAGDEAIAALVSSFDRFGSVYKLISPEVLGDDPRRILAFLDQLNRIDSIGDRSLRQSTIKQFQAALNILQIAASDGTISDRDCQSIYDLIMSTAPDPHSGFGIAPLEWVRTLVSSSGIEAGPSLHESLAALLSGQRGSEQVPIERLGEGVFYYTFDPAKYAAVSAGEFLARQRVNRIDTLLALDTALESTRQLLAKLSSARSADLNAVKDELDAVVKDATSLAATLTMPDSPVLRNLQRRRGATSEEMSEEALVEWERAECNGLIRELVAAKREILEQVGRLNDDVGEFAREVERKGREVASGDLADRITGLSRRAEQARANCAAPINRLLADTLLGYIYHRSSDPRYPVKSGIVIGHSFGRPDREETAEANPWSDGTLVDLSWQEGVCQQRGVISGSVAAVPYTMRGCRLGRILDADSVAAHLNPQVELQFSAIASVPSRGRITEDGLKLVESSHALGLAAIQSSRPESRQMALNAIREVCGARRYAVIADESLGGGLRADVLTPSEIYLLGTKILHAAVQGKSELWAQATNAVLLYDTLRLWQDPGARRAARELAGVPMQRTFGTSFLLDDSVPPYEFLESDAAGLRIVERLNPRVRLCLIWSAMKLPVHLLQAIQWPLMDRILEGSTELHVNDWMPIEEAARRVTTEATVRELLESLTHGPNPILTMD